MDLAERQTIAAGLAEGLAYAEIARRIGRPTSTVSREVARNGHRDYTAGQAQQATRRRTRSRTTGIRTNAIADPARAFVEELTSALASTGMPRMASRVFAGLITAESDTATAAGLVSELGVSPASVSKAIGYLEGMELVERRSEPGDRREYYRVGDDVWTRAMRTDSSGHADVADAAHRGLALLGAKSAAGIRLARMGQFFGALTDHLRGSDLADPTISDAKTVIAALGQTRQVMTARRLARALGWPATRVDDALGVLRRRPAIADPFAVQETDAGYRIHARPDRLSAQQSAALVESSAQADGR
ncbi:MarR family transcriptional regulator [Microbacterium sp. TWP3-1-2b2]|uniref:GbsR/MarR family transcriptional regulator n=1 Tax=Microbacterium sp. TWP3-1-2b2 TaxID=2804651 RepID=UPI003CEC5AC3